MKYCFFLLAISFFVLQACNQDSSERDQLFQEVMKIHDDVMPKMADINRTKRGLKTIFSSDSTLTDSMQTIIKGIVLDLGNSEEAMNKWMREFDSPKSNQPDNEVMEYLKKEKVRISEVSDLMLNSLENGKQLLTDLQNK